MNNIYQVTSKSCFDFDMNDIDPKISGTSVSLRNYRDRCSNLLNTDIREGVNIIHAAELFAGFFIAGFQNALKENIETGESELVYANGFTGKTGYLASGAIARILNDWEELGEYDQQLLFSCGVDLSQKPDFSKLFLGHIDTIFPQSRHATYGYANLMYHIGDCWGVSRENRLFILGDYKTPDDAVSLAGGDVEDILGLSDGDFARFYEEAIQNGYGLLDIRLNETPRGDLKRVIESTKKIGLIDFDENYISVDSADPQHQFLRHMAVQRRAVSHEVTNRMEGAHLQGYSYGSRYLPGGHVAFCEAGTPLHKKMFMELLRHGAAAANGKSNGGHGSLIAKNGRIRYGGLTLSYPEMLRNERRRLFGFITGSQKSTSVQAAIEGQQSEEIPGSNMLPDKSDGSVLVGEASSMEDTRYKRHPWDFKVLGEDDWTIDLVGKFFLNVSRDTGKNISDLNELDFLGGHYRESEVIMSNRVQNLQTLISNEPWEELRERVLKIIEDNKISSPKEFCSKMGLKPKANGVDISSVNPHPDDLSLAEQFLISVFTENKLNTTTIITCKGHTAVSDNYALGLTSQLSQIPVSELEEIDREVAEASDFKVVEEKLLRELIEVLTDSKHEVNDDPSDYDAWNKLEEKERVLRAKLVYLRLQNEGVSVGGEDSKLLKGKLSKPGAIADVLNFLEFYQDAKEEFDGTKDLKIIEEIKTLIRLTTEQTEQMTRGVSYSGVEKQWDASWYGGVDKHQTFGRVDIDKIKEMLITNRPSMLIVNGEGFMDHEAHSITEMVTKIAVKELLDEGKLNWDMKIKYYEGVWKGAKIKANGRQILIPISEELLEENELSFKTNYPDQTPANVADPSEEVPLFFPSRVRANFVAAKEDYEATTGQKIDAAGLAVFDYIDLTDEAHLEVFKANVEVIQESAGDVAGKIKRYSLPALMGRGAPHANLKDRIEDVQSSLSSLGLFDVMTQDEFAAIMGEKRKSPFEVAAS